ncbi:MAG: hypothetical protein ACRDH6_05880, partial [Actinomycetota bacterium]
MKYGIRKRGRMVLGLVAVATIGLFYLNVSPASAAAVTDGTPPVCEVDINTADETVTISRGTGAFQDQILMNGTPVGGCTVSNTTMLDIDHTTGGAGETLVLDFQAGGLLAPGAGPDNEVDIDIEDSDTCEASTCIILGLTGPDNIVCGEQDYLGRVDNCDLNGDGDPDLALDIDGAPGLQINGGTGDDKISGAGGRITTVASGVDCTTTRPRSGQPSLSWKPFELSGSSG